MRHSVKMVEEENERITIKCQSSENANIGERAGAVRERPAGGIIQTFIRAGVRVVMTSRSVAIITLIVSNCRQENKNECITMNAELKHMQSCMIVTCTQVHGVHQNLKERECTK